MPHSPSEGQKNFSQDTKHHLLRPNEFCDFDLMETYRLQEMRTLQEFSGSLVRTATCKRYLLFEELFLNKGK